MTIDGGQGDQPSLTKDRLTCWRGPCLLMGPNPDFNRAPKLSSSTSSIILALSPGRGQSLWKLSHKKLKNTFRNWSWKPSYLRSCPFANHHNMLVNSRWRLCISLWITMTIRLEGDASNEEIWIFGFGSLIWKAGLRLICFVTNAAHSFESFALTKSVPAGFEYQKRVEGYIKEYRQAPLPSSCIDRNAWCTSANHGLHGMCTQVTISHAGECSIRAPQTTEALLRRLGEWWPLSTPREGSAGAPHISSQAPSMSSRRR